MATNNTNSFASTDNNSKEENVMKTNMNTKMYNIARPVPEFTPGITVKQYAEEQFAQNCYKVCFENNGTTINNPWMDDTGRFELTTENAISHYGTINMLKFYLTVFKRIPGIVAGDDEFYKSDWYAIVNAAYKENNQEAIHLLNEEERIANTIYDYGTFVGLDTIGQWDVMSSYDIEDYVSITDDAIISYINDYINR